jgi:multimeric flavodoxin WrbA
MNGLSSKYIGRGQMNILLHDAENPDKITMAMNLPGNTTVISDNGRIHPCVCCFGCWVKTPGRCVINDGYQDIGALISKCDRLVVINRCFYGSYSPLVHNVLDRSLSYMLPYFETKGGKTRPR